MFIKEKCLGNETEQARQGTERRELKTGKETDRTGRNDFQTRERGTGNTTGLDRGQRAGFVRVLGMIFV